MKTRFLSTKSWAAAAIVAGVFLGGCETIALMPRASLEAPDPLRSITATVNGIDPQLREVYLRTSNNQHYVVNYTNDTPVSNHGRESAIADIRVGDQVRVDVREERGRLYANRIALESTGAPGASGIRTVEGTVERVLPERGFLELRTLNGELITVYVPESSTAAVKNRFNRIREGDHVRLEGERLSEDRLELLAFR
jgi:translation initiation factor IF-1